MSPVTGQRQQNAPPEEIDHIAFMGISGRNGSDPAFMVPDTQCIEAMDVDWYSSSLGRRRGGARVVATTGGTAFSSGIRAMFRHVPSDDPTQAELWAVDGAGLFKRLAGGTAFANVTLNDAISGTYGEVNAVSLGTKLFLGMDTTQNRGHVYDPVDGVVRRIGMARPVAATVANGGSGAYAATKRFYKIIFERWVGGVLTRQTDTSPAVSFTPDGAHGNATVTMPALIGEGETNWRVFGSADDSTYHDLSGTIVVGTTTWVDTTAPASYAGTTPFDLGTFTPPPSFKYAVSDDTRIIMAGAWESTTGSGMPPSAYRVWWSAERGATDISDDERVNNTSALKGYGDVEEAVTGLSKPLQGAFYVYSYESIWKFIATGNVTAPYVKYRIAGGRGCIQHKTIVAGDDEDGDPCIYWLSRKGPSRASKTGQQFCGEDVIDIWTRVNLDAATTVAHSVYHEALRQVWFYIAIDGANTPNFRIVFDTRLGRTIELSGYSGNGGVRKGWSLGSGESAKAYCSVMFSDSLGPSMGRVLKPYIGYTGSSALWKCDTADQDDAGNLFKAYVESKPLAPWGLGRRGGNTEEAVLIAKAQNGASVTMNLIMDEGARTVPSKASLDPTSDTKQETRVFPQFEGTAMADVNCFRIRVGDQDPVSTAWNLDAIIFPVSQQGER